MSTNDWAALLMGLASGALLAGLGLSLWLLPRLRRANALALRLDAARQQLLQQNNQARKQVEQLQQELAEFRLEAERAGRPRVASAVQAQPQAQPTVGLEPARERGVAARPDGFAPTQEMPRSS
jgi:hypothetical protein